MKTNTISQKEIAEGLKKGSSKELKYLYLEVRPKVRTYIIKNGGSASDVNDIFQVAIMAARMKLLEKGKQIGHIENYIFTTCVREWLKTIDKKERELKDLDDYTYYQEHGAEESKQDIEPSKETIISMKAYKALKSDCRKLFKLTSKSYSTQDIADELNVTEDFVKTKRARCKKYFMKIFNELLKNG